MKVWLIKDGEHLPLERDARPMRMWLLARALRKRGHEVTWWSSTFSHQRKRLLVQQDAVVDVDGITLRLLDSGTYASNVSLQRYMHHRRLARRFREQAALQASPDLVVTAFPIIELASAAVEVAAALRAPSVVDVRDVWPEVFIDKAPKALKPIVSAAVRPLKSKTKNLLRRADGLVGVSESYLRWALNAASRERRAEDAVFYIGCDDSRQPEFAPQTDATLTCVFVGSFGLSYDLDVVCDAASMLYETGDPVQFVLVGDGQQYEKLLARSRSLTNVTLTGWLNAREVSKVLARSSIGLSPVHSLSNPSTLSNKMFEYFAAGLPVISSVEGETIDLLVKENAGLGFRRGDAADLARAIRELAGNPRRRLAQSRNARQLFESRFDAALIYSRYASYLESIARPGVP